MSEAGGDERCSQISLDLGEQLFGTAPVVTTWFLLEYNGRWESKAFEDSALPENVKEWLAQQAAAIPDSRIQMIRQQPRLAPEGLAFYIVLSREANPTIYRFMLNSYEDLLTLDIAAITTEDPAYQDHRQTEQVFLVCTHGRRDRCCAQYGIAVYDLLVPQVGANVWQSSHVVGHRFAANIVCLPYGIYYGRMRPDLVPAVLEACEAGKLYPLAYRGRSCYSEVVQAAEYFLRTETGITGLNAFRLSQIQESASDQWMVRFAATSGGENYTVHLASFESSFQILSSCRDTERKPVTQYRLLGQVEIA
jgi:hypothetical protein